MKKSYWLYKMCLLAGWESVFRYRKCIGYRRCYLTQQQSKITASGVV